MNAIRFAIVWIASALQRVLASRRLPQVSAKVIEPFPPIISDEATPNLIEPDPTRPKVSRKVIVPARPDGSTQLGIEIENLPADLAEVISRATTEIATASLGGRLVKVRLRDRTVELAAAGQVRLLIWANDATAGGNAQIVIDSRALETLGATRGWAEVWLRWATEVLTGQPMLHADALAGAEAEGWRVTALDLAAEVTGLELTTADQAPERWTSRYDPVGRVLAGNELRKLELANKTRPISLEIYRKDLDLDRLGRGAGLRMRWQQAGWLGDPLYRVEVRFRGPGLVLRPSARSASPGELLDLGRPTLLVDPVAIARAWAHAVGHPDRRSGLYRLTLPDHEKTRLCEVDPRWIIVQQATPTEVPVETLAQRAERRTAEREDYETKADAWLANALARRVSTEGLAADEAPTRALEHARRLLAAEDWSDRYQLALADVQDLIEPTKGGE